MSLTDIQTLFAKDSFVQYKQYKPQTYLPTNLVTLDMVLGGGLPIGRLSEVWGPPDTGKTTLAGMAMKSAQQRGWAAVFIDLEAKTNIEAFIKRFQLPEDPFYAVPPTGEQAVDTIVKLLDHDRVFIVVDSLARLYPASELTKEIDEVNKVGAQAQFIKKALGIISPKLYNSENVILFTNQVTSNIGGGHAFYDTPGGNAAKHAMTLRLQTTRMQAIKDTKTGEEIGSKNQIKLMKNHMSNSTRNRFDFEIDRGGGISPEGVMTDELVERDLILRKGAWYSFGPELVEEYKVEAKIGQGRASVIEFLLANPKIYQALYERLMTQAAS